MRRHELSGSVQCRGPSSRIARQAWKTCGTPRGDVEHDLNVGGGVLREAEGVIEENFVGSRADSP